MTPIAFFSVKDVSSYDLVDLCFLSTSCKKFFAYTRAKENREGNKTP
jgi:hypothetical protein